jgi:hypothetical protein
MCCGRRHSGTVLVRGLLESVVCLCIALGYLFWMHHALQMTRHAGHHAGLCLGVIVP